MIKVDSCSVKTKALLDSGASACFIDKDFVEKHNLPLVTKKSPIHVEVIDGRPLASGSVTEETKPLDTFIENHQSYYSFQCHKIPVQPCCVRPFLAR